MTLKQITNIANGIISGIVLACGIIMCVLVDQLFKSIGGIAAALLTSAVSFSYYWVVGFGFIIPGLIGVVASFVRNRCVYIIQMILAVAAMVLMGIMFMIARIGLSFLSVFGFTNCAEILGACVCSDGIQTNLPMGESCGNMDVFMAMADGTTVMAVVGWMGSLAAFMVGRRLAFS